MKNKIPSLTKYVIFSILIVILYTIVVLVYTAFDKMVPDGLTTCFFATFGGEVLMCAVIKIFKIKGECGDSMEDSPLNVTNIYNTRKADEEEVG